MPKNDDFQIQDAVIVEDEEKVETASESQTNTTDSGAADVLLNLEQLIKNHISQIDKIKEDQKIKNEMLEDILNNDPTYKKHSDEAKAAAKVKTATRGQILKQPQAATLNSEVKDLKANLKELQQALSDYLREYGRMAGVNEIEGEDGVTREIVYTAKLIKKNKI